MYIKDLQSLHFKTKEMLKCFGQKKADIYFERFVKSKVGIKERKELRRRLIGYIETHKNFLCKEKFSKGSLLTLGIKPKCSFASLSISHCSYLGAFILVFNTKISIGFDIEHIYRITKKLLCRISLKEEIISSPNPALLWVAKEACFKCISDQTQKLLLRDCLISDWKKSHSKDVYFFKCRVKKMSPNDFLGVARLIDGLALAYVEWRCGSEP